MRARRAVSVMVPFVALLTVLPTAGQDPTSEPQDPSPGLIEARADHHAVLLPDGRVLIIGGVGDPDHEQSDHELDSVESWDPAIGGFAPAGALRDPLIVDAALLLPDGGVMVLGDDDVGHARIEVRDPVTGDFSTVSAPDEVRSRGTATLLGDGRIMVVGGQGDGSEPRATAAIWDPAGSWLPTGALDEARFGHTGTLLADGRVLIAGGIIGGTGSLHPLSSAEVWDPVTGSFSPTGSMAQPRVDHSATLLPDGRVLVVGGRAPDPLAAAEVWDPATDLFTPTSPLAEARSRHTATALPDGRVLVMGGTAAFEDDGTPTQLATAETFDPVTGSFSPSGSLRQARSRHTATLLSDGRVLAIGGAGEPPFGFLGSAELWDPATATFGSPGPAPSATPTTATLAIRDCQTPARAWRGQEPPANDRRTGELTGDQGTRLRTGDEVTVEVPPVAAGSYDSGCSGRSDFRWYRLRAVDGASASGWISTQAIAGAPAAARTEPTFPDWSRPGQVLDQPVTDLAIDDDGTIVTVTETDEGIAFATNGSGSWTHELIKRGGPPNARKGVFHVAPRVAVDQGRVAVVFDSMQQEGPGDCAPGPCWDRVTTTVMIKDGPGWTSRRLKRTVAGPIAVRGGDVYVTDGRHLASLIDGRWREEDVPARYRHAASNWQRVSHLAVSAEGVVHVAAMDYLGPEIGYARKDASGWESRRIPTDVGTLMGIAATRDGGAVIGYASGRERNPDDLCGGDCVTFEAFHLLTVAGSETRDRVVPGEGWGVVASDAAGRPIVVRWSPQGIVWRRWIHGVWQTIDWQVPPWEGSFATHQDVGGVPPHGLWVFAGDGSFRVAYRPEAGGTWLVEGDAAP